MFNKVFDKLFKPKGNVPRTRQKGSARTSGPAAPKAKLEWEKEATREIDASASPEELCRLRDGMTRSELRTHLADLYRRHNRATSSLDPKLRKEAELMLDAVVECRKRYLDE